MLNENVRRAVEESGLKQKFIAEQLGVSSSTFSAIMSGNRRITTDEFFALSKVLKISADELYNYRSAS